MERRVPEPRMVRLTVTCAAIALLAVACGSGTASSTEYEDPSRSTIFEIPRDWHLYEADELTAVPTLPFVTDFGTQLTVVSKVGFDGATGRDVKNLDVGVATAEYPVGSMVVRAISSVERDLVSRNLLESAVLYQKNFSISTNSGLAEDFEFDAGFEGIRRFVSFQNQETKDQGVAYFISVTNPEDSRIYTMAAGCSITCFETYRDRILEVVDSWLVNTRQ
jgi:hypothetical protein